MCQKQLRRVSVITIILIFYFIGNVGGQIVDALLSVKNKELIVPTMQDTLNRAYQSQNYNECLRMLLLGSQVATSLSAYDLGIELEEVFKDSVDAFLEKKYVDSRDVFLPYSLKTEGLRYQGLGLYQAAIDKYSEAVNLIDRRKFRFKKDTSDYISIQQFLSVNYYFKKDYAKSIYHTHLSNRFKKDRAKEELIVHKARMYKSMGLNAKSDSLMRIHQIDVDNALQSGKKLNSYLLSGISTLINFYLENENVELAKKYLVIFRDAVFLTHQIIDSYHYSIKLNLLINDAKQVQKDLEELKSYMRNLEEKEIQDNIKYQTRHLKFLIWLEREDLIKEQLAYLNEKINEFGSRDSEQSMLNMSQHAQDQLLNALQTAHYFLFKTNDSEEDLSKAIEFAKVNIENLTNQRKYILTAVDKELSTKEYQDIFGQAIELAFIDRDTALFLEYIQEAKFYGLNYARVYKEHLKEKMDIEALMNYKAAEFEFQSLQKVYMSNPDSIEIVQKLNAAFERKDSIQSNFEIANDATLDVSSIDINIALENIPNDVQILSYFIWGGNLYTSVLEYRRVRLYRKELNVDLLNELCNCTTNLSCDYYKISKPLSNQILPDCKLKENLIIIPHNELNNLSFDILLDINNEILIQNHNISYAYDLEDILGNYSTNNSLSFAGIAPIFDGCTQLEALQFAQDEVAIASNGFAHTSLHTDRLLRKVEFIDLCNHNDVLHFASHTIVDNYNPNASYLSLGENCDSTKENRVYISDVLSENLKNELIVLSSCQSAAGEKIIGEGSNSLARAFIKSDVSAIVSSLWHVNDQAGYKIMTSFYKKLRRGKSKPEALRDAKLEFLNNHKGEYKHPFYWANFTLVGDTSALFNKGLRLSTGFVFLLAIVLLMFIYFLMFKRR